jgi:hypothetical protein
MRNAFIFITLGALGVAWYAVSNRHSAPPDEFAALELTLADIDYTGTCYSLAEILRVNPGMAEKASWNSRGADEWTMRVDEADHRWHAFTFAREGGQLRPVRSAAEPNWADAKYDETLANLAKSAVVAGAPKVARCRS